MSPFLSVIQQTITDVSLFDNTYILVVTTRVKLVRLMNQLKKMGCDGEDHGLCLS